MGYPIIAKPDIGVGAAHTYRLENDDDLAAFLADRPHVDYILEEELTGELLSFDGLVDRRGEIVFSSSLVYGVPVLDAVRGADMWYWIDREIAPDLADVGRGSSTPSTSAKGRSTSSSSADRTGPSRPSR